MYDQLLDCFAKFRTSEAIQESIHRYETQINESLNQAISRTCPKFKLFGTTMTLTNRISKVVCTRNLSFKRYYDTIFEKLSTN